MTSTQEETGHHASFPSYIEYLLQSYEPQVRKSPKVYKKMGRGGNRKKLPIEGTVL